MFKGISSKIIVVGLLLAAGCAASTKPTPTPHDDKDFDDHHDVDPVYPDDKLPLQLCSKPGTDGLCSVIPNDLEFKQSRPAYGGIVEEDQRPFDNFSWQAFVGLNWPAAKDGAPLAGSIADKATLSAPRVWESYATMRDVFGEDGNPAACNGVGNPNDPILDLNFLQATTMPLIDRHLNFALYDVRMNPTEVNYIRGNKLDTKAGQIDFFKIENNEISFPTGTYDDYELRTGGSPSSIEIKATWRILTPQDKAERFYTVNRRVLVPAADSVTGKDTCFAAKLGMVAFHIMARTTTDGQPQNWIWPTFEHVDNAPIATDAADQSKQEEMNDCIAPTNVSDSYSFFDPHCTAKDCPANDVPMTKTGKFLWAAQPPYAAAYANKGHGSQVVRCWDRYSETEIVNNKYHQALKGTPFQFYRLVNTQWDARGDGYPSIPKAVPHRLSNAVAETFDQSSSCIDCHKSADTAVPGKKGNLSFLLRHAK